MMAATFIDILLLLNRRFCFIVLDLLLGRMPCNARSFC
jgi:hypothetical protein